MTGSILIPKLANEERRLLRLHGSEEKLNKSFKKAMFPLCFVLNCTFAHLLDLQCWVEDNFKEIEPPAFPASDKMRGVAVKEVQQACITMFGLYYDQVQKLFIMRNTSNDVYSYLVEVLFIYLLTLFY